MTENDLDQEGVGFAYRVVLLGGEGLSLEQRRTAEHRYEEVIDRSFPTEQEACLAYDSWLKTKASLLNLTPLSPQAQKWAVAAAKAEIAGRQGIEQVRGASFEFSWIFDT